MTSLDYERMLACRFAGRLAKTFERTSKPARKLLDWMKTYEGFTGLNVEEVAATRQKSGKLRRPSLDGRAPGRKAWQQIMAALEAAETCRNASSPDDFACNIEILGSALGLESEEIRLLDFVGRCSERSPLSALIDGILGTHAMDSAALTACCLDMEARGVRERLTRGRLTDYGLAFARRAVSGTFAYYLNYEVADALLAPHNGIREIERKLIGEPLSTSLETDDFAHVIDELTFAVRFLAKAAEERTPGINLLLYGAPGTGKTELSKLLAREAGLNLFAVGENRRETYEPDREDRIESLLLAGRLALRRTNSTLLFDEMEDLLEDGDSNWIGGRYICRAGSKVFMNRVLESNPVPVIWVANTLHGFDPAFLRRMGYAIELRLPGRKFRRRQWEKAASARDFPLSEEELDRLSARQAAPGVIAKSLDAARMAGGSMQEAGLVADSINRAMGHRITSQEARSSADVTFDIDLINTGTDLRALESRLCEPQAPHDISFCFHGPAGTGKTAYVRHVARLMGLDVLHKRASDLMSCWVGETEQQIADAFEDARRNGAFLVFDEADSLLADRRVAGRSWEISQVNEMLTWMETHPLPFACTTNLMHWLDPAAMRRFTFKVKFDYLRKEQAGEAFKTFFGVNPPSELAALQMLTPGDFAVVRRKTRFMPAQAADPAALLAQLEQECAHKPGQAQAVGFRPVRS